MTSTAITMHKLYELSSASKDDVLLYIHAYISTVIF